MTGTSPSRKSAYVALFVLMLSYLLSYVDRTALGVLQEPIKQELGLSDWQLGLLSGPAFALLYSIVGLPLARLSEHRNRSVILAACLVLWSVMTMVCGLARTYAQMLLARVGVSIGEAGGTPAAHSLIADLFPSKERGRALAFYSFGAPAGAFLGAVTAGWLAHHYGWRTAFIMLGPPGFVLAIAVIWLVPQLQRGRLDVNAGQAQDDAPPPPFSAVLKVFFSNPVLRHSAAGAALIVLVGYGIASFLPSFLIRRYGLDIGAVGLISGLVNGVGAGVGTLASGFAADRFGARNVRFYSWLPAIMVTAAAPCFILGFLSSTLAVAVPLLMIATLAIFTYLAPTFAQMHNMIDARMRATASSIMYLIMNLIGLGIGPPLIGLISDYMTRVALTQAAGSGLVPRCVGAVASLPVCQHAAGIGITYALVVISLILFWAAAHFWIAGYHVGRRRHAVE
ncbi:MFS transporter [Sphingobium sp. 3R8]|uniref:spinster family MFS transporter n=1 Tax=Sphingobium sp. 3R8 TaxID=2874921 RepID=UPI001CC9A5AA|nr:MFS transporter [Sphingobium sp. 3R8]MBZ9649128.1 MFS transporter [Sphingobium sp. 3R8]